LLAQLTGSGFKVQACPGATECAYKFIITFYGIGFPPPHPCRPGLGQGFKSSDALWVIILSFEFSVFHFWTVE
jgi:hypothetical protein